MEPPSALALGFDIAANPLRWSTAAKARDAGRMAASRPFGLIEDEGKPGLEDRRVENFLLLVQYGRDHFGGNGYRRASRRRRRGPQLHVG